MIGKGINWMGQTGKDFNHLGLDITLNDTMLLYFLKTTPNVSYS